MFIDKLIEKIKEKNNPSVVGLDPVMDYIPSFIKNKNFEIYGKNLKGASESIIEFNKSIIDEVYDVIPAIKPQLACYEMFGIEGMIAFQKTVQYAKERGLLVIADGKRNDIGSSAECYSNAFLGKTKIDNDEVSVFDTDALTVSPYLGVDGIKPFVDDCIKYSKGIFVLVKTSNNSSGQFQDILNIERKSMYESVAGLVSEWGETCIGKFGYSSVGAVVGATYPEQAKRLREIMPSVFFLVPGYGAQGGTASDIANSFDKNGLGAIVNSSRGIMCAYKSEKYKSKFTENQFALAAREESVKMRDEINRAIK